MNFEDLLGGVMKTCPETYKQAAVTTNDNLFIAKSIAETNLPNEVSNQDIIEIFKVLTKVQHLEEKKVSEDF